MNYAQDLQALISDVRSHPDADLYRSHWGNAKSFEELPVLSRERLAGTPLSRRLYKEEKACVKVVRFQEGVFLSSSSFKDIGKEEYGLVSVRPMVYLRDPHESIEKSVWCYERGMVPLIGENNILLARYMAEILQIDSLIADADSLGEMLPYLESRTTPLTSISILGSSFETTNLLEYAAYAKMVRLVLALPETGAFAEAVCAEKPQFSVLPDCIVEHSKETLVVTKVRNLITPIIRYDTGISASDLNWKSAIASLGHL